MPSILESLYHGSLFPTGNGYDGCICVRDYDDD